MNLESHVVSLTLSRELKEAGVKQESLFYWTLCNCESSDEREKVWSVQSSDWHDAYTEEWSDAHSIERSEHFSAFLASELGEMLCPNNNELLDIETYKEVSIFPLSRSKWCCSLMPNNFQPVEYYTEADTEADARAKMLLHLIQSGVVKL